MAYIVCCVFLPLCPVVGAASPLQTPGDIPKLHGAAIGGSMLLANIPGCYLGPWQVGPASPHPHR